MRRGTDTEGPTVVWQCAYKNGDERGRALAVIGADDAFSMVLAEMGTLTARFEREVYELDEAPDE